MIRLKKCFCLILDKIVPLCLRVHLSLQCLIFGFLRNKLRKCPVKLVFRALNSFVKISALFYAGNPEVPDGFRLRADFCNCLVTTNIRSYADNPFRQSCINTVPLPACASSGTFPVYSQALGICYMPLQALCFF
jgi:hypothetical protein